RGQGCPGCHHTGYKGRVALFEVLPFSEELQSVILRRHSLDELRKSAVRAGLTTLRRKGLNKITSGVTTVEEVVGATSLDLSDG
ncbi:MAG: type II secretion system protein GspE, partial [Nitrospirales bacterium]